MKHIYSFNDYSKDINIITEHLKGLYRDIHIVALYRGGLPLGVALSNRTNSPLSILNYQRYDGKSDEVEFIKNSDIVSSQLLIVVDDLIDEGITMTKSIEFLQKKFPNNPIEIYTIFGRFQLQFSVKNTYLREHPSRWVHFEPWE